MTKLMILHGGEPGVKPLLERLAYPAVWKTGEADKADVIFRWGAAVEEPANIPTLNPLRCVLRAVHKRTMQEMLALNGIKTADNLQQDTSKEAGLSYAHEFEIPVFHLQPLTIFEKQRSSHLLLNHHKALPSSFVETGVPAVTFHAKRAVRQSVRAVYALGLDFAQVRIGITPTGRTVVQQVDPAPVLSEKLASLLAETIETYAQEWRREAVRQKPAVLGADPEFALRSSGGRFVSADKYLEREGPVGCDAVIIRGGKTLLPLAELRPEPTPDPLRLTQHIQQTMQEARLLIDEDAAWLAGGKPAKGLPLGGHIHFSGIWLSSRLLRAFDNYLAIPLVILESEASRHRRPRYGFLGDFRRKPHGGFEYRTLPSWIVTPRRAEGVLCLARLIADHYRELERTPLSQPEVQRLFYAGDPDKLLPIVQLLWADIESKWSYYTFREPLEELKRDILERSVWNDLEDIRPHWKITSPSQKEHAPAGFML